MTKHVVWRFSDADMTLSISEYCKRYIQPAIVALAGAFEKDPQLMERYIMDFECRYATDFPNRETNFYL